LPLIQGKAERAGLPKLPTMRRLLVLCLLLMLPFQGAWAVMADIAALDAPCAAAKQAAMHGAHGSGSPAAADGADAMPDCLGDLPAEPCCDGNCGNGHGNLPVALVGLAVVPGGICSGGDVVARCPRGVPDHIPEHPLRPPL
jgi:hypothetical protein